MLATIVWKQNILLPMYWDLDINQKWIFNFEFKSCKDCHSLYNNLFMRCRIFSHNYLWIQRSKTEREMRVALFRVLKTNMWRSDQIWVLHCRVCLGIFFSFCTGFLFRIRILAKAPGQNTKSINVPQFCWNWKCLFYQMIANLH